MKKIAFTYIFIVNLICLILCVVNLSFKKIGFDDISLIILSLLSIVCYICIRSNKIVRKSNILLCFIYFLQSFSFLVSNITWKFLIGTDLSFYLIRDGDLTTKLDLKLFNIYFYLSTTSNGENWGIGLNLIHIMIFYILCKSLKDVIKKSNNVT